MVKGGLAEVYRGSPVPGFENDPYAKTENEAREAGRGTWVPGDKYVSPRDWRRLDKNQVYEVRFPYLSNRIKAP